VVRFMIWQRGECANTAARQRLTLERAWIGLDPDYEEFC